MVNINAWRAPQPITHTSKNSRQRVLFLGGLGTFMELYDYTLFVTLLPFFADAMFKGLFSNPLMMGYIFFAISMCIAPMGAIFWGWVGDRFGRLKVLRFSIYLMALPSLLIAMLPTYDEIGIFAPILLFVYRIVQAFSASGELQGSKVFVMEHLGKGNYGIASGVLSATGSIGVMLSMIMAYYCSVNQNNPEFWRIPFAIGSLLAIIGGLIRKMLSEPAKYKADNSIRLRDITKVLKNNPRGSAIAFLMAGLSGVFSYFNHAFITPFLTNYGVDRQDAYVFATMGLFSSAVGALLTGLLIDSTQKLLLVLRQCIALTSIFTPLFYLMLFSGEALGVALGYCGFGFILGSYAAVAGITINTIFPQEMRCRGALFTYSSGVALFGGITPYTLKFLGSINYLLPAGVLVFCAATTWLIIKLAKRSIVIQ